MKPWSTSRAADPVPIKEEDPTKIVQVGSSLTIELYEWLVNFLWKNVDSFAWSTTYILGIPLDMIIYKLNVDPHYKPIQ